MTPFDEIIKLPEGRRLEFKETLPPGDSIAKTVIAFSNDAGGDIYIGVKDNPREITGVDEDKLFKYEESISNIIFDNCSPTIIPDISIFNFNGKYVLRVKVYPGSQIPYYLKRKRKNKGTYIRIGSTNRKATPVIIQELERQKRNISFDSTSIYELDINDLMLEGFKEFYHEKAGKQINAEALYSLKLLNKERGSIYPSTASVLLSDQEIKNKIFPYAKVECARFKGITTETIIDQAAITDPIYKQPDFIIKFIERNTAKGSSIEGVYRKDRWEYPLAAIREAVINAVIHRDYSLEGMDIKVAIFDDMLEITSPGNISPVINLENMENNPSEIRNKVLAPIFKDLKMIEQWGTGFKKIRNELKKYPELELKFLEPGMVFQVQFIKRSETAPHVTPQAAPHVEPQSSPRTSSQNALQFAAPQVTPQAAPQAAPQVPPQTEKILRFCLEEKSREQIQEYLELKDRKYLRNKVLKPLIKEKLLSMSMPGKPQSPLQRYETTESGRKLLKRKEKT